MPVSYSVVFVILHLAIFIEHRLVTDTHRPMAITCNAQSIQVACVVKTEPRFTLCDVWPGGQTGLFLQTWILHEALLTDDLDLRAHDACVCMMLIVESA